MSVDPKLIAPAWAPQIKLSAREQDRLIARIDADYNNAIVDHQERLARFRRYYLLWRGRTEAPGLGQEEEQAKYRVPILQWQTYAKLAKEMAALFGEDSDVQAQPVGPQDQKLVRKVSRFMRWLLFTAMAITNPAIVFVFRKILFGRSFAYCPWLRETYDVPLTNGGTAEEVDYEGPGFEPLWPDDLIVPAEPGVQSIQDFSWVIRKYRVSPEDLLADDGTLYQGIEERFERILTASKDSTRRWDEPVQRAADEAENVLYEGNLSGRNLLEVREWYGSWRMLKGRGDGREDNLERRGMRETELVVRYLPQLRMIVGVQDLARMYPRMRKRRPFQESALVRDGSYWSPGFGEMLELIENFLTTNNDLGTRAMAFAVGPMVFYRPDSGFDPETFEYAPGKAIACADPSAIRVITMPADLAGSVTKEQQLLGHAERVTGISDMNMGRAIDRPNAPKTARQTMALLNEGDLRASLELTALREDWSHILRHFWQLVSMYAPPKLFFRVTEEEAGGLFDTRHGGAYMTAGELGGRYDFDLKFATSVWSRENKKQQDLALYQLDMQNPLVVQNPRALWHALDRAHRALGDDNFSSLVPMPPDAGLPKTPDEEDTLILQGEEVDVNPADEDTLHLLKHRRLIQEMREDPERDREAFDRLVEHATKHVQQLAHKKLMIAMAQSIAQNVAAQQQQQPGMGGPGSPIGAAGLHPAIAQFLGAAAEGGEGQPGAEQAPEAVPPQEGM